MNQIADAQGNFLYLCRQASQAKAIRAAFVRLFRSVCGGDYIWLSKCLLVVFGELRLEWLL